MMGRMARTDRPPGEMKVAVTVLLELIEKEQVLADPEQSPPDQPTKVLPGFGVAVKMTLVPLLKVSVQSAPQLMPTGLLVTVPDPVPALVTMRELVVLYVPDSVTALKVDALYSIT
jgi:hypothetical protein